VMKTDLAGGQLPSGLFGANAAWWALMILAHNLNTAIVDAKERVQAERRALATSGPSSTAHGMGSRLL
jgi:hypothetical protein